MKSFSYLRRTSVAAVFLGASAALLSADNAGTPRQGIQTVSKNTPSAFSPDKAEAALLDLGRAVRLAALSDMQAMQKNINKKDLLDKAEMKENLKEKTKAVQALMNTYLEQNPVSYIPPLKVDGNLGARTAELILRFAHENGIANIFINGPEEENSIDFRFLRNTLQKVAPESYIYHMRAMTEDLNYERQDLAQALDGLTQEKEQLKQELLVSGFSLCLNMDVLPDANETQIIDDLNKSAKDPNYISRAVPDFCQPYLLEMPSDLRQSVQQDFLTKLFNQIIPKDETASWCHETAPALPDPETGKNMAADRVCRVFKM